MKSTTRKNFIGMDNNQQRTVLRWRNTYSIRKWMHSSQHITYKKHLHFLSSLKNSQTKLFFSLFSKKECIGVIYFTDINFLNKSASFGLYVNPALHKKGSILQKAIFKYAFHDLKLTSLNAEVIANNKKAIHLYKKFGFKHQCK
jgi:UDP-4-amino-4,6-dideoxy-N-acetyl-beta-L-altrosamine N-acetyltransferase